MGVPNTEQNTRSLFCHLAPTIVFSSACLCWCLLGFYRALGKRHLPAALGALGGGGRLGPPLAAEEVRLTESV